MNFQAWLVDTVTVASVTSKNSYSEPTFGTQSSVAARVENIRRLVKDSRGQKAVSSHTIYTATAIALSDRIWLPGADTSTSVAAKVPISVMANHDKWGNVSLYEVHLA